MTWGSYIQDKKFEELDQLGSQLSLELDCAVHYPAYNKNLFECECGVIFPLYLVRSRNWELMRKKHAEERGLAVGNS